MTIIYLAPGSPDALVGGIRKLHDHVQFLNAAGLSTVGVSHFSEASPNDLLVVPEMYGDLLHTALPGVPRVALVQNGHMIWQDVADQHQHPYMTTPELRAVLCVSDHAVDMVRMGFPSIPVPVIRFHPSVTGQPYGEREVYCAPWPRSRRFSYFDRKNSVRMQHILQMLTTNGILDGWEITSLDGLSEEALMNAYRDTAVFFVNGDLEGCPGPPLEAMANGCVVVGFSGFGGREYGEHMTIIEEYDMLDAGHAIIDIVTALNNDPMVFADQCAADSEWALSTYSRSREIAEMVDIFRELM